MPLTRVEVRNVYGLGQTELYTNVDREDPKAILDGLAVSGLVGILRQLGDLSEFAADIFHGIQEEVMVTASRSNQLKIRLQHIEATVSPLEKSVLAQTNHIHFAYTGGVEWHPRIANEQNQLIYNDLPRFIMDPYEDCRDPPRLHLLDKFDINGPGSCLKRYSDPTYFRRVSTNLLQGNNKFPKDKNNCKIKKKKSSLRSRDVSRLASMANRSARKTFTSFSFSGQTVSSKTASASDMEKSSDSRSGSGYIESLSTETSLLKTRETPKRVVVSSRSPPVSVTSVLSECETKDAQLHTSKEQAACGSSCVSWDEKAEIVESLGQQQQDEASEMMEMNSVVSALDKKDETRFDSVSNEETKSKSGLTKCTEVDDIRETKTGFDIVGEQRDSEHETESEGDCFVDAPNTIEMESEVASSSFGVTYERLSSSYAYDETNHQNPHKGSDITRSQRNDITVTFVPAIEKSLHDSSNPLYHCDLQEHRGSEISCEVEAVKIWTNGVLLGLKPSKPQVVAVPSSTETEKDKPDDHVSNNPSLAGSGVDISVGSVGKGTHCIGQRACPEPSSSAPGLNQTLKDSSFDDIKTLPATIPEKEEVMMTVKKLMDPFRDEAPVDWLTSSPPLGHMKISLNPVDTLQPSRLKLKVLDGDGNNNNSNTFYSFQLLPETATTSFPDSDDDDTFCNSSDYLSDNLSLSNSEQWEEEEEESSNSHERKNDSSSQIESSGSVVAVNLSYLQNHPDPLPPPLPPLQWMASKRVEDKSQVQGALGKHSLSTVNKELPNMVTSSPQPEIKVHLKNNVREIKQRSNTKEAETEDLLQLIRTQQNNLRPVVMTTTLSSAAATTGPTINTKISAILEKANSIRQAVASEDGDESDSWSDT